MKKLFLGISLLAAGFLGAEDKPMLYDLTMEAGRKSLAEKKYVEAQAEFGTAMALAETPDGRARAQNQLGFALKCQGRCIQARAVLSKTLDMREAQPATKAEAQHLISHSWIDEGKWEEAYKAWGKLLEMEADLWPAARSETYMVVGSGLFQARKYAEARAVLQKCVQYQEGEAWHKADAQLSIAKSHFEEGQLEKAKTEFDKFLGMAGGNENQKKQAHEYMKKIQESKPAK